MPLLAGAKFFTQLDLRSAFWKNTSRFRRVENSQHLVHLLVDTTTNVLPFGVKPASEICQKHVEMKLSVMPPILMHARIIS